MNYSGLERGNKNGLKTLKLFISNKCNMNCTYCYVKKDDVKSSLSLADCLTSVANFLSSPGEEKIIQFLGGEPLLEFGKIKKIINFAQNRRGKKELHFHLNTNGLLLNRENADFFQKNNTLILISLDGSKKQHDKHRKLLSSRKSSYEIISNNLKKFDLRRTRFMANYVFTVDTIDEVLPNIKGMVEMGFSMIDFRPDINILINKNFQKKLETFLKNFSEYYLRIFREGQQDKYFFVPSIKNVLDDNLRYSSLWCNSVILAPDKNYYSCCRLLGLDSTKLKEYSLGDVEEKLDEKKRIQFLAKQRKEIDKIFVKCRQCKLLPFCYCKIDTYLYFKAQKKDPIPHINSLCSYAKLFKGTLLNIVNSMSKEKNEHFLSFYRNN